MMKCRTCRYVNVCCMPKQYTPLFKWRVYFVRKCTFSHNKVYLGRTPDKVNDLLTTYQSNNMTKIVSTNTSHPCWCEMYCCIFILL